MIFTADKLKEARDAGYSDDEIWSHVSSTDNRFNAAKSEGYSLDEVATYFSSQEPVGTSIGEEISQIPAALKQSFGQPLEAMGETAQVAGFPAVGAALKGAIQEPEGYVSAGERFMAPKEGEFQIAGFAPQYAPRAIAEQTGQIIGSIGTRIAGAVAGGGLGALISPATGVAGAAVGQFAGPALFEAAQIVGPVALERAKNNGYAEPTDKDMAYAVATAAGSGLLNAFGAKYLPGGEKAVGSFAKRLAASFIGEGVPEGLQSFTQQVGETIETEKGIQVNPKQAIGEALIGGAAGATVTTIAAPFTPEQIAEAKITESANKEAENLFIGNDNPQGKAVLANKQKLEQEIADTKQVLQAIESTDPIAQKLKLELKEKGAILAAAQGQVDSIVESADPVAEAEKQQIELAKAITTPEAAPKPLPTDVLPTETPGATYGREEQVYDVFGDITRKPVSIPKPAELPAAPTIEEQTAEGTYGGQTGVFDVFAGARRKPVEVAPAIAEPAPVKPITPAPVTEQAAPAVVTELEGADPIVAAAVRQKDGRIFSGSLHVNAIDEAQLQGYNEKYDDKDYGFITRSGKFLDSKSAREYAISQKQVKRETLERIEKEAGISDVDEDALESGVFALAQSEEKTEAPAPEVALVKKPSPIESFKENVKNSGFKYITYSDFRKAKKTEDWENEGGVTIDESYYPTAVVGDTSIAFTTNGLSLYKGRVEVSYEADVDASGNNIFTIERIVTPEGKRGMGSASKALSEVTSSADKAGLTLQLEPAAVKPLIKKGGKGLTSKQLVDWYKRNGFVQKFEGSDLILIRQPASTTPAVSETITEPTATPTPAAQEDVRDSRYRKFLGESAPQAISQAKNALSVFKTTMLGKRGDSPFQAEPRLRELKNSISLFVANRLNVTNQKADEIAEQIILGKPNIVDKVTELKPIKAKELDDIGASRSSITRFGYELDDKKTYRHPREGEGKPKLGQKGGVLIPTKEDFIQAGQNIYEAGMEFGAWAKQMIQRFGDAVREFLGEVWQAVSGAPAKFNELMGYLPKKGETGALTVGKGKMGEKAKVEEKPTVEAEPDKEQIKGEKIGPPKKTPEGIIAKTQELLRKQFDPSKVTEQNTTEAFRALGRLMGKGGTDFAKELNDIGRVVDKSGAASEISMGAALFINDLFEYSIRLAAEGNKKLLGIMLSNINKLPTAGIGVSQAARDLRARLEIAQRFLTMGQAEQDAYTNYVAEFIYQPNPTKEQIQSIKDAYAAVEKTEPITGEELTDEIAAVGGRTGTDLVGKINEEFTKATEKKTQQRKTEEAELDKEYKKVQKQADAEIEKLAKIQSDTPSFDPAAARQTANDVRAIVSNDLKQRPDMGRKAPWKSMLVAKLQEAGVELTAAETLADIVWRQHEINNLSRELSSINKAIEKGPISEIVKAIKDTPLEDQQKPNWRYEVMRDYLRRAGLNVAQSERIAKLMDISLQKRFTMAQEQAFTDAISKTAPWKSGDTRSRRAFQKVLQALRAGALDPARNVLSDMAALNGWTGFTPEQYKDLLKYDAILSDPESADATKAQAHKVIQDIISKAKLPIRARDVIGQYYDAQALSGIPTVTVNIFSPAGVAVKNALTQALNGVITARPEQITSSLTTFIDSIKSWANTVAFSFKNNVTVYSNVEYLVNDEGLLKLYKKGVDQFNNGKTPRDRADGVKNMMIGMMDYVRRILNALDYGAIASLQNQSVSKYALAAMQAKGMSSKDGAKMLNAMMEEKRNFYNDQIAIGTDKNKAAVLADEFFISSWRQALTDAKLPAQQVMDAALNDAMSAVGRNRQSLDAFREEETNIRDNGVTSFPAIWLLETMANAANRQDSQFIKIFSRIIYGFAIVPARVLRETAWFSPYGAVRFAYDAIAKKMGKTSPYAQSLGNDLQYRQRLTETIAGSLVMLAFGAAMSASTDDEDDEKPFKIVVTGNGPLRNEDPQFYDSWMKKNRPNTVSVYFGKTKFTLNTMRGFEAFAWPAMMLGAVDDWNIRRKQKRETNTPMQMGDAAIIGGFILSASLRRGPYAFAAKPLFEAYGDRGVESLAKSLAFPAKTVIPVLGSSLASNLSNFLNEPIDRKTLEGALWANVPFIGPAVAPKSLNAFGEPAMANDAADKIFKLGVPIVFDIPTDRDSVNLHELVLKQGGGPSIPTRNQLAQRLDRQPTNKEYEMFAKEYGAVLTTSMKKNYEKLSAMKPEAYTKVVERIGNRARDIAENKVRVAAKKP